MKQSAELELAPFRAPSRAPILIALVAAAALPAALLFFTDNAREEDSAAAWTPVQAEGPIIVRVTGRDYFWSFRFPGPDAEFDTPDDVLAEKVIHLPPDRDVRFLITSDDFVYTLSIPRLGLRQIAVPDLTFNLEFHTTSAGAYEVIADPLCSVKLFHDEDMGQVTVQSEAAFDSWYLKHK
jgi:heme/copper-type cytochrome/quinol oxidase subunit 2